MKLLAQPHPALRPWLFLLCLAFAAGCQDGSGPGLATGPEAQSSLDKKPPQPPPTPADPAIAFIVRAANGYDHLKVMDADGSNATTIFRSERRVMLGCGPTWSPDGSSIAFPNAHSMWLVDVTVVDGIPMGSNARVLLDRSSSLFHPAWSPLGDRLAFTDIHLNTIETIPATGGPASLVYTSTTGRLGYPAWSPDADRMAFTEGGAIRVLDVSSGEATTVLGAEWGSQFSGGPQFLDWARTRDVLAFSVGSANGRDLAVYTMQLPDGPPVFLVQGSCPTWSPDDQKICFSEGIIDLTTMQVASSGGWPGWFDWRR